MLQRNFSLISVFFIFLQFAESKPVGDFAPLEVGNQWVYQYYETAQWPYYSYPAYTDTLTITSTLYNSFHSNDSLYHVFENRLNGTSIVRTLEYDTTANESHEDIDTVLIFKTNWDTLIEINGQIIMKFTSKKPDGETINIKNWWLEPVWIDSWRNQSLGKSWKTPIMPVWYQHFEDTSIDTVLGYYNKVYSENNGVYEFKRSEYLSTTSEFWMIYQQNLGLVSYQNKSIGPLAQPPILNINLVSFTNITISNYVPQVNPTHDLIHLSIIREVKLSLPHLSIENNNRVFNLQGRSLPSKTLKTSKKARTHEKQP